MRKFEIPEDLADGLSATNFEYGLSAKDCEEMDESEIASHGAKAFLEYMFKSKPSLEVRQDGLHLTWGALDFKLPDKSAIEALVDSPESWTYTDPPVLDGMI